MLIISGEIIKIIDGGETQKGKKTRTERNIGAVQAIVKERELNDFTV